MTQQPNIQEERLNQFDAVDASCRELFAEKNVQYKDAIRRTGLLGAAVEIVGIAARLEALVLQNPTWGESEYDAVVDKLKDCHNYANIGLIMIALENWNGGK